MGRTTVVMRRWRYSDRGMTLVYTREYLNVMRKLKTDDMASFKHHIADVPEHIMDGTPYDFVTIKYKKRLTNKAA